MELSNINCLLLKSILLGLHLTNLRPIYQNLTYDQR